MYVYFINKMTFSAWNHVLFLRFLPDETFHVCSFTHTPLIPRSSFLHSQFIDTQTDGVLWEDIHPGETQTTHSEVLASTVSRWSTSGRRHWGWAGKLFSRSNSRESTLYHLASCVSSLYQCQCYLVHSPRAVNVFGDCCCVCVPRSLLQLMRIPQTYYNLLGRSRSEAQSFVAPKFIRDPLPPTQLGGAVVWRQPATLQTNPLSTSRALTIVSDFDFVHRLLLFVLNFADKSRG